MKTNKFMDILRNRYVRYGLALVVGVFLGWLIFGGSSNRGEVAEHINEEAVGQVWTCSMHPQIRQDKPGKCPICGMDLIPLKTSSSGADGIIDADAIQLSKEAVALANVQTTILNRQNPTKDIQLYGTIQPDERLSQSQTSHVGGRIEKLHINFTGESVRSGQTIATIYSPELLNAQQELLEALKMQQPALLQAARDKLRLWKLTDEQIERVENSSNVSALIDIKANTGGVVVSKNVSQGDYINAGSVLFNIANLSRVWAMFDAYEVDLPFLKVGDKVSFTLQAVPSKTFSGKISFIDPILDKTTRTAKVRVETDNQAMLLKPEMYANATVTAALKQFNNQIVLPKSAILWTGKRSIVYVKQANIETPTFMLHEVDLGPSLGDSYVILSGVSDGDEVVTNGAFVVDATAQLEGKRSMMNNDAPHSTIGHQSDEMINNHGDSKQSVLPKNEHAMMGVAGACEMCKERIEKAAKGVSGVTSAVWNMENRELHLNFDSAKTNLNTISKAIVKVGHDTDRHKADDTVYNALPGCCKYR